MKISKKTIREIRLASAFEGILRDRFQSSYSGFFLDNAPDMWDAAETKAFDMVTQVEDRLKESILQILGVESDSEAHQ